MGDEYNWRVHLQPYLALGFLFITTFWLVKSRLSEKFTGPQRTRDGKLLPSDFPNTFPLLGTLPLTYLWSPISFVLNPGQFFQSTHPVRVKILIYDFYVVRGVENVKAIFKSSGLSSSIPFVKFALGHAFGMPKKALSLYDRDDSGANHQPHPDSSVEARNRIDWRDHQSLVAFLEGTGLLPFCKRFAENMTERMSSLYSRHRDDWNHHPDLMKLIGDEATTSIVNALCGPHVLRLHPNFVQDYWDFDKNLQTYLQGIPWFFAPRAYAAQKRVLNAVKSWQEYARNNFDPATIDSDGDDPFWGSSFFRKRQEMFLEMDGFDHSAIASADFGAIWAARNAISASSWAIYNIYRDPNLLADLRTELDSCMISTYDGPSELKFNMGQLLQSPILQAVYAETLRLRMHFYIIRMPDRVDMPIRDWVVPRKKIIVVSTTVAHMDIEAWDTKVGLDKFWAGRFLSTAASKPAPQSTDKDEPRNCKVLESSTAFSLKGLEGAWIPYGGGPRQCPGRHFAKRQILLTIALMVSQFDCEILDEGRNLREDHTLRGFGSGISHPAAKVPIKLRRRRIGGEVD